MIKTKDKIVDIVIKHINSGVNIDEVSVQTIASEAGIGKSTIYEYFTSKEELVDEAFLSLVDYYEKVLFKNIRTSNFEGSMKRQILAVINVMTDAKLLMEAIFQNNNSPKFSRKVIERIQQTQKTFEKQINSFYKMGLDEKIITDKCYDEKSNHIVKALMSSLSIQYVTKETNLNLEEIVDLIYDSIILYFK